MTEKYTLPQQYLKYDFTHENIRHRGCFVLDDDSSSNITMMYDDHDLEVTWVKQIRHKGTKIELNIVIDDDANGNPNRVIASAWVCVYKHGNLITSFEPDCWSYIDEEDETHNTCKGTFYVKNPAGLGCKLCNIPEKCRRKQNTQKCKM